MKTARLRKAWVIALAALTLALPARAEAPQRNVTQAIEGARFEDVRLALIDAIAEEGIGATTESRFGQMIARTAADLGHRADLYLDARIYTFCSVAIAVPLTVESPHNIAQCPLSVAIYQLPETSGIVHIGYRGSLDSPAGQKADAMLARIVARVAAQFTAPPR